MGPLWASKFTPSFWQSFSWRLVGFFKPSLHSTTTTITTTTTTHNHYQYRYHYHYYRDHDYEDDNS